MPNTDEFQESGLDAGISEEFSNPFPTLTTAKVDSWLDGENVPPETVTSGDDIPDVGIGDGADDEGDGPRAPSSSRSRISRVNRDKGKGEDKTARDASSRPPSLDEWANFFGKIVLRTACDFYISYAFRGIDEDWLSEREIERLAMTEDERRLIATPLAELSNKSKFMRRHGRTIVASGDAFNAMVVLGAWMSRVNRIAAKYKPRNPTVKVNMGASNNGSSGQGTPTEDREGFPQGTHGGRVPNGYAVYNTGSG